MYDLGLLEGVVGVTLLEFVVLDTEDSGGEGILGADGGVVFSISNVKTDG